MQTFDCSTDVILTAEQRARLTKAALKRFKRQIDAVTFFTVKDHDVVKAVDSYDLTDVDEFLQVWDGYVTGWLDAQDGGVA